MSKSVHIMAARSRRGAGSSAETQKENGKGEGLNRKTIETIKDATGQHKHYLGGLISRWAWISVYKRRSSFLACLQVGKGTNGKSHGVLDCLQGPVRRTSW